MGVVFLGHDVALDRPVAVKVLRPEAATAVAAERFLREARLLARLQHPHVIPVHQAGESAGLFYFVMDPVEGETLATRLARGPLGHSEAVAVADQLLDALESAHRLGIIHRDIKPSNIFLTDSGVRLGDFGIARGTGRGEDETLTRDPGLLGTPAYMAPEQAGDGPVTAAADLYAVGLVLYECLTGRRWPRFADPGKADWSGVPGQLRGPLSRALSLHPGERWPDTGTFRRALRTGARFRGGAAAGAAVLTLLFLAWQSRSAAPADPIWGVGDAAPRTAEGRRGFDRAERLYRNGIWDSAGVAFAATAAADSACLICVFRLVDVDRWLEYPPDRTRLDYLMAVRDRFPQPYRELIEAQALEGQARLDALAAAADRYRAFPMAQYLHGNEVFNRGPLFRIPRDEAVRALELAVQLDSAFAAPWFDLTLARIASGDAAGASRGLNNLKALEPTVGLALAQYAIAGIAFAFRFGGDGLEVFRSAMQSPSLQALPHIAAGPRVLAGLGTPAGAVRLGQEYERMPEPVLSRSGLVAQITGYAALGRIDSLRTTSGRLGRDPVGSRWSVFGPALEAALLLTDDDAAAAELDHAATTLGTFVRPGSDPQVRRQAGWLLALLHRARGDTMAARIAGALLDGEPQPTPAATLLAAATLADAGNFAAALDLTDQMATDLSVWDQANQDPVLRGAYRLFRARWIARAGNSADAALEYLWQQHFHLPRYPTAEPTPADGDWALGTQAEWLQARLLDQAQAAPGACRSYVVVAERWREATGRFRARADSAAARLAALDCPDPA